MCKAAKTAVDNSDLVAQTKEFISVVKKISTLFQPYLDNEEDLPDFGKSLEPLVGGLAGAAATFDMISSTSAADMPEAESLKNDITEALKPVEDVVDRIGVDPLKAFAAWLDLLWTGDAGDDDVGLVEGMDEFLNPVLITGVALFACHF